MLKCINSKASWNACVKVTESAMKELRLWKENVRSLNEKGKIFNHNHVCLYNVFVDASNFAYGGYVEKIDTEESCFPGNCTIGSKSCSELKGKLKLQKAVSTDTSVGDAMICCASTLQSDVMPQSLWTLHERSFSPCRVGKVDSILSLPEVGTLLERYVMSNRKDTMQNDIMPPTVATLRNFSPCRVGTVQKTVSLPVVGSLQECSELSSRMDILQSDIIPPTVGNALESKETPCRVGTDVGPKNDCSVKSCSADTNRRNDFNFHRSEVIGEWSESERTLSSTWRETEAVNRVVHSHSNVLKDSCVKIFSDNQNVKSILLNGSRVSGIHRSALQLNELCEKERIILCPKGFLEKEMKKQIF